MNRPGEVAFVGVRSLTDRPRRFLGGSAVAGRVQTESDKVFACGNDTTMTLLTSWQRVGNKALQTP